MRTLLALMMLNGLSFIFWGCTGLCRFVYERTMRLDQRRIGSIAIAMATSCVIAVLLLLISYAPTGRITSSSATLFGLDETASSELFRWGNYARIFLSGAIALFAGLRVFRVARHGVALAFFVPLYFLALDVLGAGAGPLLSSHAPPFSTLLGLASSAAAFGVLLARLPHDAQPEAEEGPVHQETGDPPQRLTPEDVAVIVCAHNEEQVIRNCLDRIAGIVPINNIFVGSDGSTDQTVAIVEKYGCSVLDIQPNGGKARALDEVLRHFDIYERFEAVLILDADSEVDEHYLERALPLFDEQDVVAIAGHAEPKWFRHILPKWAMFFAAYRVRLYWWTQAFMRYGQTWKFSNVSFIIPGFASMYRSRTLQQIDIAAPGLSVEDFNMTFDVHRKKLGKIAYTPRVRCTSQEAHALRDYTKQVRRWYLGFWQTVRRHGVWPSFFWVSLGVFVLEMLIQSVAILTFPFVTYYFLFESGAPLTLWLPQLGMIDLTMLDVIIGVFIADYALTTLVATVERKPVLMFYGLGFVTLRCLDAFLFLYTLLLAFFVDSDGRWVSPERLLGPDKLSHNQRES